MKKLIVTVGPSSIEENCLSNLKKAGADIFRINLSHSNEELLDYYISRLKDANLPLSIDTQGPQLRISEFKLEKNIQVGSKILLVFGKDNTNILDSHNYILFNHPEAFNQINKGDILRIDFGGMAIRCGEVLKDNIYISTLISCGSITINRAVDIVDKTLKLSILTSFDKYAISYAYSKGCRKVFASFVSSACDVREIKEYLPHDCELVSKIETINGIKNIEEIISISNQILIDRGDLSRETSISMVPFATKHIIEKCKQKSIPVYIATNVLDSMMVNSIPSRAEVSDIFNLLNSSVSGLVLAAEVAIGNNPVKSVALLRHLMSTYENYENDFLNATKLQKPPKELIGEELFNWI